MVRTLLFIIFCYSSFCFSQTPETAPYFNVSSGHLQHYRNFPSAWVPARNIEVWLPPGYDSTEKYPVLYMHDAQMLFDSTKTWNNQEWGVDEVMSELITKKEIPPLIIVGIWNADENRHAEYFPQKPFKSLEQKIQDSLIYQVQRNANRDLFSTMVYSDDYLKFLVAELKPFIDETYPTQPDAGHTYIAGSSMGGLISLYAICEYPDVFGGAACLSTHWPGIFQLENNPIPQVFMNYLATHIPDPSDHKFYFDHGTEKLDALYPGIQHKVDSIFKTEGYQTPYNYQSLEFKGADHSEKAWQERLYLPMKFLFK